MGLAKALMMEIEETQWEEMSFPFDCPDCKSEFEAIAELPVVYEHGETVSMPVSLECLNCNNNFDGWAQTDWDNCEIELDDYPEIKIATEPARGSSQDFDDAYDSSYYDWLEQQERLSRPIYQSFRTAIDEIKGLALDVTSEPKSQMLARMLLTQSITAMEVFLADTLIYTVSNSTEAQSRLLRCNRLQIGSGAFKLVDAIGINDFPKTKLIEHLRSVSFHNLKKVTVLFGVGLGVEFLGDSDDREQIQKAVNMRHDCVHRNGFDRATNALHEMNQSALFELAETLVRVITSADKETEVSQNTLLDSNLT